MSRFFAAVAVAVQDYLTHYRDLLAISVISVVNAAMCDYHVRNCPPSPQLTQVCDEVSSSSSSSWTCKQLVPPLHQRVQLQRLQQ